MSESYQATGRRRVNFALTEPVKVTVTLHPAVFQVLNVIRVADCYAQDCEPVPFSTFLSWWLCQAVGANCYPSPGGRSAHYEDRYSRLHSVPAALCIPDASAASPGETVDGVPWWLSMSRHSRRR